MVTVSNIATQILNENNYTTSDISATNLEYLIDNIIDDVNSETGLSIADLSGSAGTKSITGTEAQILVVKAGTTLMLRAFLDRGPNTGISSLSVTTVIADPQYTFFTDLYKRKLSRLRADNPPIYLSEDPVPTE